MPKSCRDDMYRHASLASACVHEGGQAQRRACCASLGLRQARCMALMHKTALARLPCCAVANQTNVFNMALACVHEASHPQGSDNSISQLALCCRLKKAILSNTSDGVYVFNQDSHNYLTIVSKSGSDYKFLRAVLILPDEYTTTNAPPYAVSTTGFVSLDPSKPVLVKLDTQVNYEKSGDCSCWLTSEAP